MLRALKQRTSVFSVISILAALLIVIPMLNILLEIFTPASAAWIHIRENLLRGYIINTVVLIALVAIFSALVGLFSAVMVTRYEFKGRQLLSWFLILPLALPSYIAAYIYADMVSYTGTVGRLLRSINAPFSIDVMNMGGAVFIFVVTLYPYVYMLTRAALSRQSASFSENARILGASPFRTLFTVIIPLLRPAVVAGTLLVVLETLNDYGVVAYFNVRVFSFAIFDAWFRLGDTVAAIRLSGVLMLLVFVVIFIERIIRGKRRYASNVKTKPLERKPLTGAKRFILPGLLWSLMALGFFIPVMQLIYYATMTYQTTLNLELVYLVVNSLTLAITATLLTVFIALMLANYNRTHQSQLKHGLLKITNLGYAIPGAVIAIAVMVFFIDIDHALYPLYQLFDANAPRLILSSSLIMLTFAFVLRFMAIGYNSIESAYDKIGTTYTEAAYSLNASKWKTLWTVDLPLIKQGLVSAMIIVFIDVFKELPLTLILRPTNYDTLASQVYRYAREEMLQEIAVPSLIMVIISSILIYLLTHSRKKGVPANVRPN